MSSQNWLGYLESLHRSGESAVVVTVVSVKGSVPRELGAKMIVLRDRFRGSIGGGRLEELALIEARTILQSTVGVQTVSYPLGAKTGQCCGGSVELLFEPINRGPRLHIFGAGHVGQSICHVLDGTPFQVHLIDERTEWRESPALTGIHVIAHDEDPLVYAAALDVDVERDYALILTHSHDLDENILRILLGKEFIYLGLIGSRSKWQRFEQRLLARGFTAAQLQRVHCPIGLPIGGKTPKEIAISVAAELVGLMNQGGARLNLVAEARPLEA